MKWRQQYKELYRQYLTRKYPATARDFPNQEPAIPSERKTNGLTKLILHWITWKGYYANRVNTQGQVHVAKIPRYRLSTGKVEYIEKTRWSKGTTKRGTPDIQAVIKGRAVFIEVKAGKDTVRPAQEKQRDDIENAGGLHFYAHDMQSFVDWYLATFEPPPVTDTSFANWY